MKPKQFWTTKEIARLRECYSTMSSDELLQAFAPRSIFSIRVKASELRLRRRRDWGAIASRHVPAFTLS